MALMMSRILSQPTISIPRVSSSFRHHRNRSNKSHHTAQLIEIDLDSSSSPSDEVITVGIKKLEDAIHGMIVRRAAPDWLPFLPGYSYWVPPRRSSSVIKQLHSSQAMLEVLGRFATNTNNINNFNNNINNDDESVNVLTEDENLSCVSNKGWPSSAFFTQGNSRLPVPVVEMEMKFQDNEENVENNEDEEG